MKVTVLLADYAQVADGKLNIIGGGWNTTGPQPMPFALAVLIEVPWDRANEQHHIRIELVDADGHAVVVPQPDGQDGPLVIDGDFEIGRPPGSKRGAALNFPLAINLPAQPIPPGSRYEWRLSINDQTDEDWRVAFTTRPEGP